MCVCSFSLLHYSPLEEGNQGLYKWKFLYTLPSSKLINVFGKRLFYHPVCLQNPLIMGNCSKYHTERFKYMNISIKLNISKVLNVSKNFPKKTLVATDSSLRNTEIKHLETFQEAILLKVLEVLKVLKLKVLKSNFACLQVCKANQGFRWFLSVLKV